MSWWRRNQAVEPAAEPSVEPSWEPPQGEFVQMDTGGDIHVEVWHLNGIPWFDAPLPPKRHKCYRHTYGFIGLDRTDRCACGAVRGARFSEQGWFNVNERKS